MRYTSSGNYFQVDKAAIQLLKVKKGTFSEFEAYCSFAMDINCGKKWTQSGYSKMWGWSRKKVKRFTNNLLSTKGQRTHSHGTALAHPIHVIERENLKQVPDECPTSAHRVPTTIKNKNKSSKKNTASDDPGNCYETKKKRKISGGVYNDFLLFWESFNYKKGKAEAADVWIDMQPINGELNTILSSAKKEATGRETLIASGKTPKMAQGWLTGKRWEDESSSQSRRSDFE